MTFWGKTCKQQTNDVLGKNL